MKIQPLRYVTALGACCTILLFSIHSFAEGIAVRYSYAKTEFNGQPIYALIPSVDPRFSSASNKLNVSKAFEALKAEKANTYLNTQISISGRDNSPTVKITIDANAAKKGYALIIMAESVYTLSEIGVSQVDFPGYSGRPMKRGDIPFVAFSTVVPLWKALNPGSKRGAVHSETVQVLMPNGDLVPSQTIALKWNKKDKSIDEALYEYLKAPDSYTVKEVAKLLKGWNLPYGDKVVQLLGNPSISVQNTGLELLADERDDKRVLESVQAYLGIQKKKNKAQAAAAAQWLSQAKDQAFSIEGPLYFIENGDAKQATEAAKQLGAYKDKQATKVLESKLVAKDEGLAVAAAEALAQQGETTIAVNALKNKKVSNPVKLKLAHLLSGTKKTSEQLDGLAYLVEHGSVKERTSAIQDIGTLEGRDSRQLLEGYLVSKDSFVSKSAAEQLLRRAELESLNAVAKGMKDPKYAAAATEIGDAIMKKLDFPSIEKMTRDKNSEIQRLAYRALSQKSKTRAVLDILERGLDNKDPSIRGAAAHAMLPFESKYPAKVEAALKKASGDKDPSVRADAARAIGSLAEGKLSGELTTLLNDKTPEVSAAAIDSLAKRGEAASWDTIKGKIKSKHEGERAAALKALARLVSKDDAKGVREVISLLSGSVGDKSKVVQIAALYGLGEFKDDRAVASIAVNASSDDIAVRIAALEAGARSGHASARNILTSGLEDKDAAVRAAAIRGLGVFKDGTTKTELANRLKTEQDPDLRKLIETTSKQL